MRFASIEYKGTCGVAVEDQHGRLRGLFVGNEYYPGSLDNLIREGEKSLLAAGLTLSDKGVELDEHIVWKPPLSNSSKIICVGLNYIDHSLETGFKPPKYPTIFSRFNSSLIGHNEPILKPKVSDQLDYEGELAAVIGARGRYIEKEQALDHVIGYSVFNDASIRDYQVKSPQWTMGKNFDNTGAFGPTLVTADELPKGCKGLKLQTRLNGNLMQEANIDDMIFDVANLVTIISEVMTLEAGDIIVTGTPAGIGWVRKPPIFMKAGDLCEVSIEKVGLLVNPIQNAIANNVA